MALTRDQAATQIYYQLQALWDTADLTYTSEAVGALTYDQGDMTLPLDRALRAMKYDTDDISSATSGRRGEEELLDLTEYFALERLVDALAIYVDEDYSDQESYKESQMLKAAERMLDRKKTYVEREYGINTERRQLRTKQMTRKDGYEEEAGDSAEYSNVLYKIKAR